MKKLRTPSKKKNVNQPKITHKYNIFLEVTIGLLLPIIASLWLGNYYSDRIGGNLMLESLMLGLAFGILNVGILLHKEISRFYHNHHHPKHKK